MDSVTLPIFVFSSSHALAPDARSAAGSLTPYAPVCRYTVSEGCRSGISFNSSGV
ncbi:hypothetical protein D3C71_1389100 [compost metagenome]